MTLKIIGAWAAQSARQAPDFAHKDAKLSALVATPGFHYKRRQLRVFACTFRFAQSRHVWTAPVWQEVFSV